jgi:Jacalin-like lectin domain
MKHSHVVLGHAQAIYAERPGPIRGSTQARDSTPDYTITFAPGEQITGIFGYTDTQYLNGFPCCSNYPVIRGLGFWTSLGNQFGQYGPSWGSQFSLTIPIRGFYGHTAAGYMRSIGIYVPATTPPPAPPSRPPPPPSPATPPAPNLGRVRFPSYGDPNGDSRWDDGPGYTGKYTVSVGFNCLS